MSARNNYSIRVSRLTKADAQRLDAFLNDRKIPVRDALIGEVPDIAGRTLLVKVSGYKGVAPYVRAAPGCKPIVDILGKESFALFGGLLAVALQAGEDAQRSDLDGAQKLGRASIALLGAGLIVEAPPLGLAMLGAAILFPQQYDAITAAAFTDKDPAVRAFGNAIAAVAAMRPQGRTRPLLIELH